MQLKSAANPKAVAQRIVNNGGLKVLDDALKKYPTESDNPNLIIRI